MVALKMWEVCGRAMETGTITAIFFTHTEGKYKVIRQYRWCKLRKHTRISSLADVLATNDTVRVW
jgi:hypothetical protein